jgi:hypothetical protein
MTVALWWFTAWYSARLFHAFCVRFPSVAQREIPYALDRGVTHPEKAIFFFRRRAAEVTSADSILSRQRKRFIALSVASLVFPVLWFAPLCIYAGIMSHK